MNKISIVFTARNDNYGGDLITRINALLKGLIYATNKIKHKIELIIVEYNPPSQSKRLHEVLSTRDNKYLKVRLIEFPARLHKKFLNSERIQLFEYTAKNIGIRRATGDYIVSTNQDIIFSPEFIKYLCNAKLDKNAFYRTDRIDVHFSKNIFSKNIESILDYCYKNKYLIKTTKGDKYIKFTTSSLIAIIKKILYEVIDSIRRIILNKKKIIIESDLHTYAAGDFLMMHKDVWNKLGGYDETKKGNNYLDSFILHCAISIGLKQCIIKEELYHVDHYMTKIGRPSLDITEYEEKCLIMKKTGKPYLKYQHNWGENNLILKEFWK